ncbi:MAG: hypothetical protein WCZ23_12650, partial [Rhodospirillaceae bacterium]
GDADGARDALGRAARLFADAGDLQGEADTLMDLGAIEQTIDPVNARRHFTHAAALFGTAGHFMLREAAEDAARGVGR